MSIVIDTFGSDFKQIVATEVVGFISVDVHSENGGHRDGVIVLHLRVIQLADLKEIELGTGPNLALEYGVKKCGGGLQCSPCDTDSRVHKRVLDRLTGMNHRKNKEEQEKARKC